MLLLIAILLAAILITLLGAWGYVPRTLAVIVGIVLWVFLAGVTGAAFGEWGVWMVLALPFVMAAGFGIVEFARGNIDMWGNPKNNDLYDRKRKTRIKGRKEEILDPRRLP